MDLWEETMRRKFRHERHGQLTTLTFISHLIFCRMSSRRSWLQVDVTRNDHKQKKTLQKIVTFYVIRNECQTLWTATAFETPCTILIAQIRIGKNAFSFCLKCNISGHPVQNFAVLRHTVQFKILIIDMDFQIKILHPCSHSIKKCRKKWWGYDAKMHFLRRITILVVTDLSPSVSV